MGVLENAFEENVLTTKVDWLLNWATSHRRRPSCRQLESASGA